MTIWAVKFRTSLAMGISPLRLNYFLVPKLHLGTRKNLVIISFRCI